MPAQPIDWSQLWYPGRKQPFTADEMARAGGNGPSQTLVVAAWVNFVSIGLVVLQLAPPGMTARFGAALAAIAALAAWAARWLWWRPWRRPLLQATIALAVAMVAMATFVRWTLPDREQRYALALVLAIGCAALCVALWFLVFWRAEQITGRLRELAERERAVEMAQRLASAQLAPHFLFNTLASVQHWVATHDERAGPLLESLTGYLRATLPMFARALHPAGEEVDLVRRYLEVMQARLGSRLRVTIELPAEMSGIPIPPGVLLTLAENAIEHAIDPRVAGGALALRGRLENGRALFIVEDDGPGLPTDAVDGIGLANIRERLRLTRGERADLAFDTPPGGGCRATVTLPLLT